MRHNQIDKKNINEASPETTSISTAISHAWQLRNQSHLDEASAACRSILSIDPTCGQAWHLLGLLAHDQGDHTLAVEHLKKAISVEPDHPIHHNNLGVVLQSMSQYQVAEYYLRKALKVDPEYHDAKCNLGLSLYHQHRLDEAADFFEEILCDNPQHDAALANLGLTRLGQQNFGQAAKAYEKALSVDSNQPQWHGNLGAAYMRLARYTDAVECYRRAAQSDRRQPKYLVRQAIALRAAGDLTGSISVLEQALAIAPDVSGAISNLVVGLEYICDWDKLERYYPLLHQATQYALKKGQVPDEDPMLNIRHCNNAALNQAVSRAWSRDIQNKAHRISPTFRHSPQGNERQRLTIGYLSYDFRNHPVAHQLFPLFKMHDRKRFRVIAFSMGVDDSSSFRRKIESDCDEFVDISAHGLTEAAQAIHNRHVDILIDLMGHSHHNRMGILALRPAPLQVSYLGFLSTTGADFIDYVLSDPVVVPKLEDHFYDEKLVRLPNCYQLNHTSLMTGGQKTTRKDWGLPQTGFVYCSFNTVYKIDRELFDLWMRILTQTPGSCLWLNGGNQMASKHMCSRAEKQGVDPHRLIFAEKIPLADHLDRLRLADLALDTLRYNGGATTANALGVGLPVVTVMGRHWVSRMTASHLFAAGLPDFVQPSPRAYEQYAIQLCLHREKLLSTRQRLINNAKTHPLFDTQSFVDQLEAAYESIWDHYKIGLHHHPMDIPVYSENRQ